MPSLNKNYLESEDVIKWFENGPLCDLDPIDRIRVEERMLSSLDSLDEMDRDITMWELFELSYRNGL